MSFRRDEEESRDESGGRHDSPLPPPRCTDDEAEREGGPLVDFDERQDVSLQLSTAPGSAY